MAQASINQGEVAFHKFKLICEDVQGKNVMARNVRETDKLRSLVADMYHRSSLWGALKFFWILNQIFFYFSHFFTFFLCQLLELKGGFDNFVILWGGYEKIWNFKGGYEFFLYFRGAAKKSWNFENSLQPPSSIKKPPPPPYLLRVFAIGFTRRWPNMNEKAAYKLNRLKDVVNILKKPKLDIHDGDTWELSAGTTTAAPTTDDGAGLIVRGRSCMIKSKRKWQGQQPKTEYLAALRNTSLRGILF